MQEILSSAYGQVAAFAGILATLWGITKAIGALKRWYVEKREEIKKKKELPQETLRLIQTMRDEMEKHNAEHKEQLLAIQQKVEELGKRQEFTEEQVATVQNEKLCWAYIHYGKEKHPITLATKTSFELMYKQYKQNGGRNHVPADWQEVMNSAPMQGADEHG